MVYCLRLCIRWSSCTRYLPARGVKHQYQVTYLLTRMPGERYRRRVRSLLLCSCDVFRALINSLCLLTEVYLLRAVCVCGGGGGETNRQRETVARTRKLYLPGLKRDRETKTERDRHRQTDRDRETKTETDRQTETDRDRGSNSKTLSARTGERERDRERQRETERDRDRDRQTETERPWLELENFICYDCTLASFKPV